MKLINFKATDNIVLNGILYESSKKTDEIIIAIHGMSSNCFKQRDTQISKLANENNIDYFCFNNRGSELIKYIKKEVDKKTLKKFGGTTYEDVLDGYYDICGAILKVIELGYTKIHLQGHSLGCTKIVYTYNKLKEENNIKILNNIKSVILLSLIDIPEAFKVYLDNKYNDFLDLAQNSDSKYNLMPKEAFIHPISVKTFLRYAKYNENIDFARYGKNDDFEKLNNIKVPLFMRWGNVNEMVTQKLEDLVQELIVKIDNNNKDISYIDGADHGYTDKEEALAEQIIKFIKNIQK